MISLIAGALLLNAFAVLSQAALATFSLADAEELLRKRDRIQTILPVLERFVERAEPIAFTLLLLSQICKAVAAVGFWLLFSDLQSTMQLLALLISLPLAALFFDVLVRPLGEAFPEPITIVLHRSWRWIHLLLWLPLAPFHLTRGVVRRWLHVGEEHAPDDQGEDEILAVVASAEARGRIEEHEREMIESVLGLSDLTAEEIMTPRTDMSALSLDAEWTEVVQIARDSGHSRLPVFRENRDDIIGVLYVKDLIGVDLQQARSLQELVREPLLIPASKSVGDVLADLRRDRIHLAVILDEYGGTAGVLTLEDIIEEVFGEIEDEYDEIREEEAKQVGDATLELDARMKVEEVNDRFGLNLPESEHYESLGGLVTSMLGCIPIPGEHWHSDDGVYRVTVLDASDRRVDRVRVERTDSTAAAS
jgi:CBS domain containing-hemolysin-like protein